VEEGIMSAVQYPNEFNAYRSARDALLVEEKALVEKVRAVAEQRRRLPLDGQLKENYVFQWASADKLGHDVLIEELFGDQSTLLLYNFMYGPNWDNPCLSCTSLMDGFDRTWYQVSKNAAFVATAKASPERINSWAKTRDWKQIPLVSGHKTNYQADYRCQGESDDMQYPMLQVFKKTSDGIFHFWGSELQGNHVDTVWPYWNMMDFTPEGRPDIMMPPQNFRSNFLEDNYINTD